MMITTAVNKASSHIEKTHLKLADLVTKLTPVEVPLWAGGTDVPLEA